LAHAPDTYRQVQHAVNGEKWQKVMQYKLDKMEKYRVWNVIDREDKKRVVEAKWVGLHPEDRWGHGEANKLQSKVNS
jgi:hypothetical protein